jgi:hypothetical protein
MKLSWSIPRVLLGGDFRNIKPVAGSPVRPQRRFRNGPWQERERASGRANTMGTDAQFALDDTDDLSDPLGG